MNIFFCHFTIYNIYNALYKRFLYFFHIRQSSSTKREDCQIKESYECVINYILMLYIYTYSHMTVYKHIKCFLFKVNE